MSNVIVVDTRDNVAIPVTQLGKGSLVIPGVVAIEDIPQSHKVALADLEQGEAVIRYGVVLGYLKNPVKAGGWINEHMLELPEAPTLDSMEFGTECDHQLPEAPDVTFEGYDVLGHDYAGTRNILGIMTTVQCVAGVLDVVVERMKRELLPKYAHVDDIIALNHAYGCGVAINAREAHIPIRSLRYMMRNPNFGGELMVVGPGCEKLTVDMLLEPDKITKENVIILQDHHGFQAMIEALMTMAEKKLEVLNTRRRTPLPLSKLCIGMQCGGSDAFSGITANPAAGHASDLLVSGGATVLFSEVTE